MKLKLCGFKNIETIEAAIAGKVDFLGFIFVSNSPRFTSLENAVKISRFIPKEIKKVAVVLDAHDGFLREIAAKFKPDFFQFHGAETPEFIAKIKEEFPNIGAIKGFKISQESDLNQIKNFENICDYLLLDGKNPGSGESFDWNILQNFNPKIDWFLSGGININNIDEAISKSGAKMIDISSGIEEVRGQKSPELIADIFQKIQQKN